MEETCESSKWLKELKVVKDTVKQASENEVLQAENEDPMLMSTPVEADPEVDHNWILATIYQIGNIEPLPIDKEPKTWSEAKDGPDAERWEEAYKEDLKSSKDMGVYWLIL